MSLNHTRRGTLIIVVAGMSALLATLAVTFAVKVRGEANGADQMVRIAQARIMLNAFMAYSIKTFDNISTQDVDIVETALVPNFFTIPYPVKWQPADPIRPATFNTAWMVILGVVPGATAKSYTAQILIGAGPTQGEFPPVVSTGTPQHYLERRYEPRYRFDVTFTPKLPVPPVVPPLIPAPPRWVIISKIVSTDISL